VVVALFVVMGMAFSAAAVSVPPAAAATGQLPRLEATPSSVQPGGTVTVGAYDLAPLSEYQIQVCGNAGFGGSADCTLASTITAATSESGHFIVVLVVLRPPMPCPCVVQATILRGTGGLTEQQVSTPITIIGVPTATPVPPPVTGTPSGLVVDRADLAGTATWAEWFGGPPQRTLVLRLRDAGANPIPSTPFLLRAGPAGHPTQIVSAPVVPPLYPGQAITYRVPITFPALAHGNYVVVGNLGNAGQTVTFTATTPLMPWGIVILVAMVVLVALGLVVRRVVRRRRERRTRGRTTVETPTDDAVAESTESPESTSGPTETAPLAALSSSDPESPGGQ
jgi:hypothetical protein